MIVAGAMIIPIALELMILGRSYGREDGFKHLTMPIGCGFMCMGIILLAHGIIAGINGGTP